MSDELWILVGIAIFLVGVLLRHIARILDREETR